jgi:hypothetical protein
MTQVSCERHGLQGLGIVCIHVALAIDAHEQVGFFWDNDAETGRPSAWCAACESALLKLGGGPIEDWARQADFKILCACCWDEAKEILYEAPRRRKL